MFLKKKSNDDAGKLDRQSIVRVSMNLLHEEGIKKLSIRNLAQRLEVKGASLYYYIKNKSELLELVSEEICKRIEYPSPKDNWETQLLSIAGQFRECMLAVNDSAHVLSETPPNTPSRIKLIRKINTLFEQTGMNKEDIFSSSWILNNYITSFVIEEYRIRALMDMERNVPIMDELPFDLEHMNMDREFQFGMEILIEGYKKKIKE